MYNSRVRCYSAVVFWLSFITSETRLETLQRTSTLGNDRSIDSFDTLITLEYLVHRVTEQFHRAGSHMPMAEQEILTGLMVEDIGLDGEGRVAVQNPQIAERIRLALAVERQRPKPSPKPNTNCGVCNTVEGCGPLNETCSPNTVPNCGCRKLE
jgi:hypothetical protein